MSYAHWHVGMKVVCLATYERTRGYGDEILPVVGHVYTLRQIEAKKHGVCISLVEIVNPERQYELPDGKQVFCEPGWHAQCFRPVQEHKTDISIFTAMLHGQRIPTHEFVKADYSPDFMDVSEAAANPVSGTNLEGGGMTGLLTGNKTASAAVRGDDFYASPYAALPPLLVAEGRRLPRTIWEPAAGKPGKRPANQVPVRWISWKEACRKFPQTDADVPPAARQHQRGLFESEAA